jgi:hypothetical protein
MEITGVRWSLKGAEAVLRLRSLRASGDFNEYWAFHLQQEHMRNHVSKYKDGRVPLSAPAAEGESKVSHLRLVGLQQDEVTKQVPESYDSIEAISLKNWISEK